MVCYLGSLDEGDREKLWLRVDFWDVVSAKLDQLHLGRRERTTIEESISKMVTRVPEEEAASFKKERQEYRAKRAQLFRTLELMRWIRS